MAQKKKIATKKPPQKGGKSPSRESPPNGCLNTPPKPQPGGFSIRDKVDAAKTAQRFGLTETDVHTELTRVQGELGLAVPERVGGEVVVEASVKKSELHNYLLHVYNKMAQSYNFVDMATMMATAHVKLVASAIAKPASFGKEGLKALSDISRILYPPQRASIKRALPPGETKDEVLARIFNRLSTTRQALGEGSTKDPKGNAE